MKKILNLGSGVDYKQGWVNLDYNSTYSPDIVHDLDMLPYPFEDNEFDGIYCSHILAHVTDLYKTLKELNRILKPNCTIKIRTPHFSNPNNYTDLTVKRYFSWNTFNMLLDGTFNTNHLGFRIISKRFNFLSKEYYLTNKCFSWVFNVLPKRFYERFLCWILPVGEIEVVLGKINPPSDNTHQTTIHPRELA